MKKTFYILVACYAVCTFMALRGNAQTIYTFCGSTGGYAGDGGPATAARISFPGAIKYHNGYIYLADGGNELIRRIDASSPFTITTIAGSQSIGFSGDGGPATAAETYMDKYGLGIVVDNSGNVYFSDLMNNRVRKVDAAGTITTFAGGGIGSDGVAATAAQLFEPSGLALDAAGNMYIAQDQGHAIRKVDAATGIITTITGIGSSGYSGDGGPATAAQVAHPVGIAVNAAGDVYFSDQPSVIRKITASTGIISTFASGVGNPGSIEFDQAGNLIVGSSNTNGHVFRVSPAGVVDTIAGSGTTAVPTGDGGPATAAGMYAPMGVTITPNGSLLISTHGNHRIRVVTPATATISGTAAMCVGGTATLTASIPGAAWISGSTGVATVSAAGVVTGVTAGTATITYVAGLVFGTQVVTIHPIPASPAISVSGTTLSVPATFATYQWSLNGSPVPGATNATHTATADGTYAVTVSNAGGCGATSANYVHSTVSVANVNTAGGLLIAPNPAPDGRFTISLASGMNEAVTIVVTNILGEKVYETKGQTNAPLAIKINAPAGVYQIQTTTAQGRYTGKLILN